MLATLIIVFREVLEAALIVGIVLAATKGLARRFLWVGGGIACGIAGAVLVAFFADFISQGISGMGQEIFNASVLFMAVAMLGWHNIWMAHHGRELAQQATSLGAAVLSGNRPMYALSSVVALAVLREGAEVVLFLYGIAAGDPDRSTQMLIGGLLGVSGGVVIGLMLYRGLLRISTRYLFLVTGWMIALLAAGMASQGAAFLIQADFLPPLVDEVWDTSNWLSQKGMLGSVLHTVIGYSDRPTGMQLLFYIVTLATIVGFSSHMRVWPSAKAVARWMMRRPAVSSISR